MVPFYHLASCMLWVSSHLSSLFFIIFPGNFNCFFLRTNIRSHFALLKYLLLTNSIWLISKLGSAKSWTHAFLNGIIEEMNPRKEYELNSPIPFSRIKNLDDGWHCSFPWNLGGNFYTCTLSSLSLLLITHVPLFLLTFLPTIRDQLFSLLKVLFAE